MFFDSFQISVTEKGGSSKLSEPIPLPMPLNWETWQHPGHTLTWVVLTLIYIARQPSISRFKGKSYYVSALIWHFSIIIMQYSNNHE